MTTFQEIDIVGITRPCVKHNFLVTSIDQLAVTIKKSYHIARSGRPGPVLIDVPKDISMQKFEFDYPESIKMRSYQPVIKGNKRQIKKAIDLLCKSKRAVLYTGGGVVSSQASDELRALAKRTHFPVTHTLMGLGAFPATDEQFVGMLGMHGTYEANLTMHHADLIVAIGARFDDRVTGNLKNFLPLCESDSY